MLSGPTAALGQLQWARKLHTSAPPSPPPEAPHHHHTPFQLLEVNKFKVNNVCLGNAASRRLAELQLPIRLHPKFLASRDSSVVTAAARPFFPKWKSDHVSLCPHMQLKDKTSPMTPVPMLQSHPVPPSSRLRGFFLPSPFPFLSHHVRLSHSLHLWSTMVLPLPSEPRYRLLILQQSDDTPLPQGSPPCRALLRCPSLPEQVTFLTSLTLATAGIYDGLCDWQVNVGLSK